ncbi:putative oxidoreductase [Lachnellula willkommii]|uniref:Putative oxidoreductase n=1 Tax=Lachnellula willkommii TaxID=215461 RepID=A0A559MFI9_9HELO|nr:putative oxidoreductase [Lachnellula willkommii]
MSPAFDTNGVWLVTGCSAGLGQSIARHVYAAGHNIVATARNVDSLDYLPDGPKVLKLSLDVTSRERITAAVNSTHSKEMHSIMQGNVNATSCYLWRQRRFLMEWLCSKFALEGLTKSVNRELNPKWNIKLMILSPGGVKTKFASNMRFLPRHPAYDNDEAPLTGLSKYIKIPSSADTWADADKCAAVLFDVVLGQKDKPLPTRLNLGADALPLMRHEIGEYLREMEDWEEETLKVMPSTTESSVLVDQLIKGF